MPRTRKKKRPFPLLPVLCACVTFLSVAILSRSQPPTAGTPTANVPPVNMPPAAPATTPHPLEAPLALILEGQRNFTAVRDYSCVLVSRENVRGVLQDENMIQFKMRSEPFSVAMRWLAPRSKSNQEAVFVAGKNNNKMRVRGHGLSKVAGFVSIDVNDPRVTEHSRHTIYEAGLGNLIQQTIKHWESEKRFNKTLVKIAEYTFDNRPCYRIETVRTERRPEFYCYRSVLYLEKNSKIPVRTENYDWPQPGGPTDGALLESFSYVSLRFNQNLSDSDFTR